MKPTFPTDFLPNLHPGSAFDDRPAVAAVDRPAADAQAGRQRHGAARAVAAAPQSDLGAARHWTPGDLVLPACAGEASCGVEVSEGRRGATAWECLLLF